MCGSTALKKDWWNSFWPGVRVTPSMSSVSSTLSAYTSPSVRFAELCCSAASERGVHMRRATCARASRSSRSRSERATGR